MEIFNTLLKGQEVLFVLVSAFVIGGALKTTGAFVPLFSFLLEYIPSKRFVLALIGLFGGVLPVEGRVTISAPILDSMVEPEKECGCGKAKCKRVSGRQKMGIIDYVANHHYYLWSPLEKTVLLPMVALGMTYIEFLSYTALPLLVYLIFFAVLLTFYVEEEDITLRKLNLSDSYPLEAYEILPLFFGIGASIYWDPVYAIPTVAAYYVIRFKLFDVKQLFSFVQWKTVLLVAVVIAVANLVKSHSDTLVSMLNVTSGATPGGILAIVALAGALSFVMGSSGKYAALTVTLLPIVGLEFFPLLLMVQYAAYLISPAHKCLAISSGYFGTSFSETYWVLIPLSVLMVFMGFVMSLL